MFRTGIEKTKKNKIFSKQTETNQKNHQKTFSNRGSSKLLTFFSRFELKQTKNQSVSVDFWFAFLQNQKIFFTVCFGLFPCFGPVLKQPKQTELIVWGIKKIDILTNLLLFLRLVFCLFRLFQNTKTPCFNIKAKQPKQTSCFG